MKPYTPVEQNLVAASPPSSHESDLYLMIKVYPDGVFTPHLNNLEIGESEPGKTLRLCVSYYFTISLLIEHRSFNLIVVHLETSQAQD